MVSNFKIGNDYNFPEKIFFFSPFAEADNSENKMLETQALPDL